MVLNFINNGYFCNTRNSGVVPLNVFPNTKPMAQQSRAMGNDISHNIPLPVPLRGLTSGQDTADLSNQEDPDWFAPRHFGHTSPEPGSPRPKASKVNNEIVPDPNYYGKNVNPGHQQANQLSPLPTQRSPLAPRSLALNPQPSPAQSPGKDQEAVVTGVANIRGIQSVSGNESQPPITQVDPMESYPFNLHHFQERFAALCSLRESTPDDFHKFVQDNTTRWGSNRGVEQLIPLEEIFGKSRANQECSTIVRDELLSVFSDNKLLVVVNSN